MGGQAALFLVLPLSGAVLVLATFGVANRVRGPAAGLIAAWLVATSPIVLSMLVLPMSDVPVAAAWISAAFFFLIGDGASSAVAAGLLSALAVLIRPNLVFLAPIMEPVVFRANAAAAVVIPAPAARRRLVLRRRRAGLIFIGVLFTYFFGSPFVFGYGRFADSLDRSNVWPDMRLYFHWAMSTQRTFTIAGLIGLVGSVAPFLWPKGNARRAVAIAALMVVAITAEYVAYIVFDKSGVPALFPAGLAVAGRWRRWRRRRADRSEAHRGEVRRDCRRDRRWRERRTHGARSVGVRPAREPSVHRRCGDHSRHLAGEQRGVQHGAERRAGGITQVACRCGTTRCLLTGSTRASTGWPRRACTATRGARRVGTRAVSRAVQGPARRARPRYADRGVRGVSQGAIVYFYDLTIRRHRSPERRRDHHRDESGTVA